MPNKVCIELHTDNNYVIPTIVTITSIIKNKKPESVYEIRVLTNKVSEHNINLLKKQLGKYGSVIPHTSIMSQFEGTHPHVSSTALFKFDLPDVLSDWDKVLYLDTDTIIQGDLSELFNTDIQNNYVAAVQDAPTIVQNIQHIQNLSLNDYFNSGVMLLNLKKMRDDNISQKLIDYKLNKDKGIFMDQDSLNVILKDGIKWLPAIYNFMPKFVDLFVSFFKLSGIAKDAVVLHYADSFKPWLYENCASSNKWFFYYKESVLKEKKVSRLEKQKKIPQWLGRIICCFIPKQKNRHNFRNKYVTTDPKTKFFLKEKYSNGYRHIYFMGIKVTSYKKVTKSVDIDDGCLKIAIAENGGIGDIVMCLPFLEQIVKQAPCKIILDLYCRTPNLCEGLDFLSNVYKSDNLDEQNININYDVFFNICRFGVPRYVNDNKVKTCYPKLFLYITNCKNLIQKGFGNFNLYTQYCNIKNKNRNYQFDVDNIWNTDIENFRLPFLKKQEVVLEKFGLINKKFILLNRDVDGALSGKHPKLWELKHYDELVNILKKKYPEILLIQVGANDRNGCINGVDLSLLGKTDFEDLKVLLNNALYLVSCEGGLVHLSHFVNGKCIVLFGPTDRDIYGYRNNINIQGKGCGQVCVWVTSNWASGCLLNKAISPCMESITAEMVIKHMKF